MYPNSGYCAETGGIMKNLRESTDNEKVNKGCFSIPSVSRTPKKLVSS